MLLQQIGVHYHLAHASKVEMIDENGYDKSVSYVINQLEELWRTADVDDLANPEKMGNPRQLEQARVRLKQAQIDIQKSERQVQKVTGKRREFFQKAHAYYHHSAEALLDIVNFLLAKKESYSIEGNEISFENESDAARFQELFLQISNINREKEEIDAFISNHNREVEKKLLLR